MSDLHESRISFLIPTRNRPDNLRKFFASVRDNTADPDRLEIVLAIDEDDEQSAAAIDPDLNIVTVTTRPGGTMGYYNRACYQAATGQYVMGMNDDIVIRTKDWDRILRQHIEQVPDDIFLFHVNDRVFGQTLCCFPFLSRTSIELVGEYCPEAYRRYRIDDHIYNIFNMLSFVGEKRIFYFPDIVFEHENVEVTGDGEIKYKADESIMELDHVLFDDHLPGRKEAALRLAHHIWSHGERVGTGEREDCLDLLAESFSIRREEYVNVVPTKLNGSSVWPAEVAGAIGAKGAEGSPPARTNGSLQQAAARPTPGAAADFCVTIGIVTADIDSDMARKCIAKVKEHTANYDLVVLDNNRRPDFNHSREMNRILSIARTKYVVLLDDDVYVTPNWLDGLIAAMGRDVAMATPLHTLEDGTLAYAGSAYTPERDGRHSHLLLPQGETTCIPTICSAATLIDTEKIGGIRVDEQFSKYYLDVDLGFRVWEEGYRVVSANTSSVVHLGGATVKQNRPKQQRLWQEEQEKFRAKWQHSGRLEELERGIWQDIPEIREVLEAGLAVQAAHHATREESFHEFMIRIAAAFRRFAGAPCMVAWLNQSMSKTVGERIDSYGVAEMSVLVPLLKAMELPPYPEYFKGYGERIEGIVKIIEDYFANPNRAGASGPAADLDLAGMVAERPLPSAAPEPSAAAGTPRLVGSHSGFNVFELSGKFVAVSDATQSLDLERYRRGDYSPSLVGLNLPDVVRQIDAYAGARVAPVAEVGGDLMICLLPAAEMVDFARYLDLANATLLVPESERDIWSAFRTITLPSAPKPEFWQQLRALKFDRVLLPNDYPHTWSDNTAENLASLVSDAVTLVSRDGSERNYTGENLHRLLYNKGYLSEMLKHVPPVTGQHVLELGCSDGLVCDLVRSTGAAKVTGIDLLENVGCNFPDPGIEYHRMDGEALAFEDDTFDLVYSIATLEHVRDPYKILSEIQRVLKPEGYCYIQAAPLFHSPFGHHQFAYFNDYPWIHLRLTTEEIFDYVTEKGIDKRIEQDRGISAWDFVNSMLDRDHLNGLLLNQFRLTEFAERPGVKLVRFQPSYEGKELLNEQILGELDGYDPDDLVAHGFDFIFQKVA